MQVNESLELTLSSEFVDVLPSFNLCASLAFDFRGKNARVKIGWSPWEMHVTHYSALCTHFGTVGTRPAAVHRGMLTETLRDTHSVPDS